MQSEIEQLFDHKPLTYNEEHFDLFYQFKHKLNLGEVRAAEPDAFSKHGWCAGCSSPLHCSSRQACSAEAPRSKTRSRAR